MIDCFGGNAVFPFSAERGIVKLAMHISSQEALALLESWLTANTSLRVRVGGREFQAHIGAITGTVVTVDADADKLQIDVQGADFHGDNRIDHSAYLVCEFRNGDRCYFHVVRPMKTGSG